MLRLAALKRFFHDDGLLGFEREDDSRSLDTLRIWQFPVAVGTGKRLFGEGTIPCAVRLAETQQTATGAVLHEYERVGSLKYGEVEVGQETVIFDAGSTQK